MQTSQEVLKVFELVLELWASREQVIVVSSTLVATSYN